MTITIKEVRFKSTEYQQILSLRYEVLRRPLGLVVTKEDVATEDKEIHIAALDGEKVIGCVLLRPIDSHIVKLRQMAVADAYQGQKIGARLVGYAEELAATRDFKKVETHARKVAQVFYEKLGYIAQGDYFTEVTIPTIKMVKDLTP